MCGNPLGATDGMLVSRTGRVWLLVDLVGVFCVLLGCFRGRVCWLSVCMAYCSSRGVFCCRVYGRFFSRFLLWVLCSETKRMLLGNTNDFLSSFLTGERNQKLSVTICAGALCLPRPAKQFVQALKVWRNTKHDQMLFVTKRLKGQQCWSVPKGMHVRSLVR